MHDLNFWIERKSVWHFPRSPRKRSFFPSPQHFWWSFHTNMTQKMRVPSFHFFSLFSLAFFPWLELSNRAPDARIEKRNLQKYLPESIFLDKKFFFSSSSFVLWEIEKHFLYNFLALAFFVISTLQFGRNFFALSQSRFLRNLTGTNCLMTSREEKWKSTTKVEQNSGERPAHTNKNGKDFEILGCNLETANNFPLKSLLYKSIDLQEPLRQNLKMTSTQTHCPST